MKDRDFKVHNTINDVMHAVGVFVILTCISFFFRRHSYDPTLDIAMLYTLGILLVTRFTKGMIYGLAFSVATVFSVNYFFTFPFNEFEFSLKGYQVAFLGMLVIAIITSVMSTKMKEQQEILLKQEKELLEQEKEISKQEKLVMEGEKEKMRANLLRAVSHDLRTPLTGIIGNTDSFIATYEDMSDEERIELVKSVNTDADWLLSMVENLLAVTRIDNETARVTKSFEAVDEVASAAVLKFRKRFPDYKVNVKVPDEVVMVEMDPILIQQVIINILQNAHMHSNSTKPLDFVVEDKENQVEFHFKDYGVGISPERMKTIFDAGKSTSGASTDGRKGLGIGLSICKTIILAHDGEIYTTNHENGAEFVFTLPKNEEKGLDYVSEDFDIDN